MALIVDRGAADFHMERRAIPAYMDNERFDHAARFSRADMFPKQDLAFRKHEDRWIQSDEFLASVAVHLTRGGVGFNHYFLFNIIEDQPVARGFKDVSVLFFRCGLAVKNLTHKVYLLLSSIA